MSTPAHNLLTNAAYLLQEFGSLEQIANLQRLGNAIFLVAPESGLHKFQRQASDFNEKVPEWCQVPMFIAVLALLTEALNTEPLSESAQKTLEKYPLAKAKIDAIAARRASQPKFLIPKPSAN